MVFSAFNGDALNCEICKRRSSKLLNWVTSKSLCYLSSKTQFPYYINVILLLIWVMRHAVLQVEIQLIKSEYCALCCQHQWFRINNPVQIECRKMKTLLFFIGLFLLFHGNWARFEYYAIRRNRCKFFE